MATPAASTTEQQHDEQFWKGFFDPGFEPDPPDDPNKGGDDPEKQAKPEDDPNKGGDDPNKGGDDPEKQAKPEDDPNKGGDDPNKGGDDPEKQAKPEDDPNKGGDDPNKGGEPTGIDKLLSTVETVQSGLAALDKKIDARAGKTEDEPGKGGKTGEEEQPPEVTVEPFLDDELKAKLEKLKTSDPDAYAVMQAIADRASARDEAVQKQVGTLRLSDKKREAESERAERLDEVEAAHPGWEETTKSKEFEAWFEKQPVYLQRVAGTTKNAKEFIEILDKFKADTKPPDPPDGKTAEEQAAAKKADEEREAEEKRKAKEQEEVEAAARSGAREPSTKGAKERETPKGAVGDEEAFGTGWFMAESEFAKDV